MVEWSELITTQDPIVLAGGVFILVLVISLMALQKIFENNVPVAVAGSLIIAVLTARQLYLNNYYGWEGTLGVLLAIAVLILFLRILWAFIKGARRNF